jgi:hypothetical protein
MPNRVIIITGCQRSGTTMLNLALDSHPEIVGIDEVDFDIARMPEYLKGPEYAPAVCFKLPSAAAAVPFIRGIPGVRVLWALRDPRAVVASMIRLPVALDGVPIPWAAHPTGAGVELTRCTRVLGGMPPDLAAVERQYLAAAQAPPGTWPLDQLVTSAALCWRLKNDLLGVYDREGIAYRIVVYEDLVRHPEPQLRAIVAHLGLAWHDDVLRHQELHEGVSVGRTDNTRAIDTASTDKWRQVLGPEQLDIVRAICGVRAAELGYSL